MIRQTAARVILVVLAAVSVVWLAYGLRALSLDAQGRAQARIARSPQQVDRALSLFAQAAHGEADPTPRIDEARFLLSLGRPTRAAEALEKVVRANPGNVLAWRLLATATAANDPGREVEANEQLFRLFGHPIVLYPQGILYTPLVGLLGVEPGVVVGSVDQVQIIGKVARFIGWSAMVTQRSRTSFSVIPSDEVMILADGRFVAGGTPYLARSDVARTYHVHTAQVGFTTDVPVAALETARGRRAVEVFASSGRIASRLPVNCVRQVQSFGCGG